MTKEDAKRIIEDEKLIHYNWFDEKNIGHDEVIIYKEDNRWVVCASGERAAIYEYSYRYYDNEEEALDGFIEMLRISKEIDLLREARLARDAKA